MKDAPLSMHAALGRLRSHPLIVAHRGDWRHLPENAIAAMAMAHATGADMVEIDTQTIADGTFVVIHDDTLDRTTDATGKVCDLDPAALGQIRLRAGAGGMAAAITDHRLPTLTQMLDALRGQVLINIDTKHPHDLDRVAHLVLDMNMQDQVLLKMSVTRPGEFADADWFGRVAFMPLCMGVAQGALAAQVLPIVQAARAPLVEIDFHDLTEVAALAQALGDLNAGIWVNTLDPVHSIGFHDARALREQDQVWGQLLTAGIGAIQTDQTEALARYLGRLGK
jgi:glycerophosphoryl diester phosphodiesterase